MYSTFILISFKNETYYMDYALLFLSTNVLILSNGTSFLPSNAYKKMTFLLRFLRMHGTSEKKNPVMRTIIRKSRSFV